MFGIARADFQFKNVKADLAGTDKWTVSGDALADVSMKGFAYKTTTDDYKQDGAGQYERLTMWTLMEQDLAALVWLWTWVPCIRSMTIGR